VSAAARPEGRWAAHEQATMTRVAVLAISLAFILGFAFLTIGGIEQFGFSVQGVLSVIVLVILTVGIVGALRNPPRR
jgi:archaellum biogenesis protein FlaJ (TadC family)